MTKMDQIKPILHIAMIAWSELNSHKPSFKTKRASQWAQVYLKNVYFTLAANIV